MSLKVTASIDSANKHDYDVNTLIFHKNIMYSGADDGKIKAWSPDLKFLYETQAHPCSVFSITCSENTLYSCSNEGTIKTWNLTNLEPKATLLQEDSEIWKLAFSDAVLYSGDDQGVIRTFKDDKLYAIINILEPVKDMIIKDMIMFTARDLDVVITEIRPGTQGDKGRYGTRATIMGRAPLCLSGDNLCFSSRGGKDLLLHINNQEQQYKQLDEVKDAHELIINTLHGTTENGENFVYSGGWDKVVKKWKISNGKLTLIAEAKVDFPINTITSGQDGVVYAAGGDGKIVKIN